MANTELERLKKQLEELINKMRLSKDVTRELRTQLELLKSSGSGSSDEIEKLTKKLEKQYNQSIKFANEARRIQKQILDIYPNAPKLDEAKIKALADDGAKTLQQLSRNYGELRGSFVGETLYFFNKQLQWYLSKAVSLTILEIPANIIKSVNDLNKVLTDLGTLTRALPSDLQRVKDTLINITTTTSFSISEIGATAKFLAQSGLGISQIVESLQPIANLAVATSSKLEDAAKAVSTVLVAMDMPVSDSDKIADILAQSTNLARLSIEDLSTSFNYTAAAAAQLNIPIENLTAYLAILSNQGLKASTAATGLRQVFEVLQAPSEKAIKTLAKYGLTIEDINPVTHDLVTILQRLANVAKHDLAEIFATRGGNAILALLNAGPQAIERMQQEINKHGIAAQMASDQMLSLDNSYKKFLNTISATYALLGEKYASPPLVDILTGFSASVKSITENTNLSGLQNFVNSIINLGIFLGPLIVTFTALKATVGSFLPTFIDVFSNIKAVVTGNLTSINTVTSTFGRNLASALLSIKDSSNISVQSLGTLEASAIGTTTRLSAIFTAFSATVRAAFMSMIPTAIILAISTGISFLISSFIKARQEFGEFVNTGIRLKSDFSRIQNEVNQLISEELSLQNQLNDVYLKQYTAYTKILELKSKEKFTETKLKLVEEFSTSDIFKNLPKDLQQDITVKLKTAVDAIDLDKKLAEVQNIIKNRGKQLFENLDVYENFIPVDGAITPVVINRGFVDQLNSIIKSSESAVEKLKKFNTFKEEFFKTFKSELKDKEINTFISTYFKSIEDQILGGSTRVNNVFNDKMTELIKNISQWDSILAQRAENNKGVALLSIGDVSRLSQDIISYSNQIKTLKSSLDTIKDPAARQAAEQTIAGLEASLSRISTTKISVSLDPKSIDDVYKKIYSLDSLTKRFDFLKNLINVKSAETEFQKLVNLYNKVLQLFVQLNNIATGNIQSATISSVLNTIGAVDVLIEYQNKKLNALKIVKYLTDNAKEIADSSGRITKEGSAKIEKDLNIRVQDLPGATANLNSIIPKILEMAKNEVLEAQTNIAGAINKLGTVKQSTKDANSKIAELASNIRDLPVLKFIDKKTVDDAQTFYEVVSKLSKQEIKDLAKHLKIPESEINLYKTLSKELSNMPFSLDQLKSWFNKSTEDSTKDIQTLTGALDYLTNKLNKLSFLSIKFNIDSNALEFLNKIIDGVKSFIINYNNIIDKEIVELKEKIINLTGDPFVQLKNKIEKDKQAAFISLKDKLKDLVKIETEEDLNKIQFLNLPENTITRVKELVDTYYSYKNILDQSKATQEEILKLKAEEELKNIQLQNILDTTSKEYLLLYTNIKKTAIDIQILEEKSKANNQEKINALKQQKEILDQQLGLKLAIDSVEAKIVKEPTPEAYGSIKDFVKAKQDYTFYSTLKQGLEVYQEKNPEKREILNKNFISTVQQKAYSESYNIQAIQDYKESLNSQYENLSQIHVDLIGQDQIAQMDSLINQLTVVDTLIDKINQTTNNPIGSMIDGLSQGFKRVREEVEKTATTTAVFANIADKASTMVADSVAQGVSRMILYGEDFGKVMKNMLTNIADMIIQTIVRALVLRAIVGGAGLFGFKDGGVMTSDGPMVLNKYAKGGILTPDGEIPVKKYASGGIARKTQVAIFGEGAMPEAFVPLPNGRSIPVTMKGAASVSNTVVQVIDQRSSGQPIQTEKSIGPSGEELIKLYIRDEVRGAMSRGSFDQTLQSTFGISRQPIRR